MIPLLDFPGRLGQWPLGLPLLDFPGVQVNGPWVSQRAQGGADKEEEEVELNKYKSQEEKIRYVRMERMKEGHLKKNLGTRRS